MPATTIIARFHERVRTHPEKVALRYKDLGASSAGSQDVDSWHDITWREYGDAVKKVGKALHTLGFKPGDKMALLSGNRVEWHFADIGCLSFGGATAPVYATNSPEQVAYIVEHSDSKVAFVENTEQLEKILKMRSELPALQKVVVFDGGESAAPDKDFVLTWGDFLALGRRCRRPGLRGRNVEHQARGPRNFRLYVRNNRAPQSGHAEPLEHLVDVHPFRAAHSNWRRGFGQGPQLSPTQSHRRAHDQPHLADLLRHPDLVRRGSADSDRRPAGVQADLLLRGAQGLGEVLRRRHVQDGCSGPRRPQGEDRQEGNRARPEGDRARAGGGGARRQDERRQDPVRTQACSTLSSTNWR